MATVPRANFMWRQANPAWHSRANYPREGSLQKMWTRAGGKRLPGTGKLRRQLHTLVHFFVCLFFSQKIKLAMCVKRSVAVCSEAPQPVWLCCDALLWLRSALFVPSVISKKSTDLTPHSSLSPVPSACDRFFCCFFFCSKQLRWSKTRPQYEFTFVAQPAACIYHSLPQAQAGSLLPTSSCLQFIKTIFLIMNACPRIY